jgi:hypothetical protein
MALDFTAFNATLQGLLDSETDPKQLLLITKSLESAGNHSAFEIRIVAIEDQLGAAQLQLTTVEGRTSDLEKVTSKPFLTQYIFGAIHG